MGNILHLHMATQEDLVKTQLARIGRRLKELRLQRGYSNYEQFAFDHNIPRAQYGRYENGQDMRISSFLKVLDALQVTPEEFFKDL